jgi:elongation factor G
MQHSLNAAVMHTMRGDTRIHLIDTPGSPDFLGQSLPALEAVETAAVVINAATGHRADGRAHDGARRRAPLDRLIIVNKIDAPGVDLAGLLAQIQATFGKECLPLNLPDAGGHAGGGLLLQPRGPQRLRQRGRRAPRPGGAGGGGGRAFVDRYLNDGDVDATELHAPLEQALREGHLIPVCFVSARSGAGVAELLDVIVKLLPNPTEGNPPDFLKGEGDSAQPMQATPDPGPACAGACVQGHGGPVRRQAWACSACTRARSPRTASSTSATAASPSRWAPVHAAGQGHVEVASAVPGDIVAVAKVDEMHFDAVLHDAAEDDHIHLKPLDFPGAGARPGHRAQAPWRRTAHVGDPDQAGGRGPVPEGGARGQHQRDHPLRPGRAAPARAAGPVARRAQVRGQHAPAAHRLPRDHHRANAEGHHRHKKQTGGAGQFGEVFLRWSRCRAAQASSSSTRSRAAPFPASSSRPSKRACARCWPGAMAGYPVVDVRVIVYDGKHHSVDSKEIAFVTAGRKAFMAAIRDARPMVLEPIVHIEITAPDSAMGDITGDLSSKRGLVTGTANGAPGTVVVRGQVPMSELAGYQSR